MNCLMMKGEETMVMRSRAWFLYLTEFVAELGLDSKINVRTSVK